MSAGKKSWTNSATSSRPPPLPLGRAEAAEGREAALARQHQVAQAADAETEATADKLRAHATRAAAAAAEARRREDFLQAQLAELAEEQVRPRCEKRTCRCVVGDCASMVCRSVQARWEGRVEEAGREKADLRAALAAAHGLSAALEEQLASATARAAALEKQVVSATRQAQQQEDQLGEARGVIAGLRRRFEEQRAAGDAQARAQHADAQQAQAHTQALVGAERRAEALVLDLATAQAALGEAEQRLVDAEQVTRDTILLLLRSTHSYAHSP